MRILVLNGSPRPEGNTKKMIAAFEEGAKLNGHQVKDDMQEVYVLLQQADMLIIALSIYYHGISGQLQCVIDRVYAAAYPGRSPYLEKAAMFLSSGDADMYDGAVFSFEGDFGASLRQRYWCGKLLAMMCALLCLDFLLQRIQK